VGFKVVIPARHGASRLPGKPLRQIAGQPMIWHVYQRALASGAEQVIIATEHALVAEAAKAFGAEVCMTSDQHFCGTDRIAEVVQIHGWADDEIIVNLQGDEPTMPAENIALVASELARMAEAEVATLCTSIGMVEELIDPNVVKVVRDAIGYALYFSRAPIPWNRAGGFSVDAGMPPGNWYRHIGLYAYRAAALKRFAGWPPSELEQKEMLEQLRGLWHGMRIYVGDTTAAAGVAVDTEADLVLAEQHILNKQEEQAG
jgi:3-deoxy-manno-octulosonate cytidylyltransferase (CMP-KDO synthetase)